MWKEHNPRTEGPEEEETPEDNGGDKPMSLIQDKGTTMPASPVASWATLPSIACNIKEEGKEEPKPISSTLTKKRRHSMKEAKQKEAG
jgi:hypothetical protein